MVSDNFNSEHWIYTSEQLLSHISDMSAYDDLLVIAIISILIYQNICMLLVMAL